MNNKLAEFCKKMSNIIDKQKNMNTVNGVKLVKKFMTDETLPFLEQFIDDATEYRKKRDKNNVKLVKLMKYQLEYITEQFNKLDYVKVILMSSIGAQINLAEGESDIDFGIVVTGLNKDDKSIDMDKYTNIVQILTQNKFTFTHIVNPDNLSNQYFSFEKEINGIEFELKVRDYEASKSILALHKFLDTKLTSKQITLFTYAKYLFKQFDKKYPNKKSYNKFKSILYQWGFSNIKGGFILNM
jgi:hypothetical protein